MLTRRSLVGMLASATLLPRVAIGQSATVDDRFSVMIWVLRKRASFEQNLETVAKAGFKTHRVLSASSGRWPDAERERYMAKMAALGITVDATTGLKLGFADPATGEAYIAELKKLIVAAKQVKCTRLILMSGKVLPSVGDEGQRAASIATLKRVAEVLEAEGMDALLEPIDRPENPHLLDGRSRRGRNHFTRAVGSPRIRVLYDFYHEQRTRGNADREAREGLRSGRSRTHRRRPQAQRSRHGRDGLRERLPQAQSAQLQGHDRAWSSTPKATPPKPCAKPAWRRNAS